MILPIKFSNDTYFDSTLLSNYFMYDIDRDKSVCQPDQDVLHNACTQMHNFPKAWNLKDHCIDFEDVLNGNYEQDAYLEITVGHWRLLKDRSWVKGKNIIVTIFTEAWFTGFPVYVNTLNQEVDDITVLEDLKLAKNGILVRDNACKIEGIKCVPLHSFYMEAQEHHKRWIPWCNNYEDFIHENISRMDLKSHKFTALLGHHKIHRTDFYRKINEKKLHTQGYIGGFDYKEMEHDEHQVENILDDELKDRFVAKPWLWNSKLWVAHETHCVFDRQDERFMMGPITEKTWKPIAFGMPFVVNCNVAQLDRLEELGFDTFRSVFGDYQTNDLMSTNDNIIDIIENIDTFETKELQRICRKNWIRFLNFDRLDYQKRFWQELGVDYK